MLYTSEMGWSSALPGDFFYNRNQGALFLKINSICNDSPENSSSWIYVSSKVNKYIESENDIRIREREYKLRELENECVFMRTQINSLIAEVAMLNEKVRRAVFLGDPETISGPRKLEL